MSDEVQRDDVTRFHLTFSLDKDGFFRRSCPSCGRDFKTQVDDAALVTSLEPAFRQMGLEIGSEPSENYGIQEYLYCPYCVHYAESGDMLTRVFVSYLRRYAMREYVLPVEILSNVVDQQFIDDGHEWGGHEQILRRWLALQHLGMAIWELDTR